MEFRLARRLIARRPLTVALQVAALFLGFVTAGLGFALHGMVAAGGELPGASCGAQARWISLQTADGGWSSRFTPAQAQVLRQLLAIPVYPVVYAGQPVSAGNTHIAGTVLGINPDALAALCVKVTLGHLPTSEAGGAVLGAAVGHDHIRIGRAKVEVVGAGTAFRGLAPRNKPVDVFVPLDTLARAGFDVHTVKMPTLALFVSAHTAARLPGDAELTRLVHTRPDVFPAAKVVHITHNLGHYGAEDYTLGHYSRALGVLGVVLVLLGLVNVATYQLGRQADLAWRSKVLRDMGAGRWALRVLAYTEPLVVTMVAVMLAWLALIPVLKVMLFVLDAQTLAAHARPSLTTYSLVFGLALVAAILLGEMRFRATGGIRSRAIRRLIQGYFTYASLIQAFACVVVLGLALAATVNYLHAQPAAPSYNIGNVRAYFVMTQVDKAPNDVALRWQGVLERLGQRVHGMAAAAANLLPVSGARCCFHATVRYKGKTRFMDANYMTPGYFQLLGMQLASGQMFGYQDLPRKRNTEGTVAIINMALKELLVPNGASPQHLSFATKSYVTRGKWGNTTHTVGVIRVSAPGGGDGANGATYAPVIFRPMAKVGNRFPYFWLLVRPGANMSTVAVDKAARAAIKSLVPAADILQVDDLQDVVDAETAPQRSRALLFNVLALGALALTLCGILGISLLQLELHRQSLAVRFSLGARLRALAADHAVRVGAPLLAGAALGAMALAFFGRQGLVYLGIEALPAWIAAAVGAGILLVCIALAIGFTLRLLQRADFHEWLRAE